MDSFHDEDNNPFSGSDHLFASGIAADNKFVLPPELHSSSIIFGGDEHNDNDHDQGAGEGFGSQLIEGNNHQNKQLGTGSGVRYSINEGGELHNGFDTENVGGTDDFEPVFEHDDTTIVNELHGEEEEEGDEGEEEEEISDGSGSSDYQRVSQYYNSTNSLNNINNNNNNGTMLDNDFITITDAGHIRDMRGNKVIAYTIKYNFIEVKRRYSEFDSFRASLVKLFPTFVIPPIPEKHSVVKYFLSPINAKNDMKVIEKRKRMLSSFLNGCKSIPNVKNSIVWQKFLDPTVSWIEVLNSPPISILPSSNLLAPPLNPTKPSPLHLLLPIPQSGTINNFRPREEDKETSKEFKELEQIFNVYKSYTAPLAKSVKKQKRHFKGLVKDLGELGAYYNAFSLEDNFNLSTGIEKTGQAIDINFINSEAFAFKILTTLEEPIVEINQYSTETLGVLNFRRLKEVQLFIIDTTIKRRNQRIESLKNAQEQANRLEEVLKRNAEQSPTIAAAVKRLEEGQSMNKVSPWTRIFTGKSIQNDISMMNEEERMMEVDKIEKEIIKLNECLKVVLRDLGQVNEAIKQNINSVMKFYSTKWKNLMLEYTESLMIWLNENLKAWEDAKLEIEKIQVTPPDYQNDDRIPDHLKK